MTEPPNLTSLSSPSSSSWSRVLEIPELARGIFQFMDTRTIHTLRLVNTSFLTLCTPYFAIALDLRLETCRHILTDLLPSSSSPSALPLNSDSGNYHHHQCRKALTKKISFDSIQELTLAFLWLEGLEDSIIDTIVTSLNQCRNLRRIHLQDKPQTYSGLGATAEEIPSEQLSYPSRNAWHFKYPLRQIPSTTITGTELLSTMNIKTSVDQKNVRLCQSYWDLLPLEGPLLNRLESLTIVEGDSTPVNLDRFLNRLRQSSASKTLNSLSLIAQGITHRKMSLEALRACLCSMGRLESFRIEHFKILDSTSSSNNNSRSSSGVNGSGGGGVEEFLQTQTGAQHLKQQDLEQWVAYAPMVKRLTYNSLSSLEIVCSVLALFPNLEELKIPEISPEIDRHLSFDSETTPTGMILDGIRFSGTLAMSCDSVRFLPHLRTLDTARPFLLSTRDESRLLRTCLTRRQQILNQQQQHQKHGGGDLQPPFQLVSLHVPPTGIALPLTFQERMIASLVKYGVSVKQLRISSDIDKEWVLEKVLGTCLCHSLESLEFSHGERFHIVELVKSLLLVSDKKRQYDGQSGGSGASVGSEAGTGSYEGPTSSIFVSSFHPCPPPPSPPPRPSPLPTSAIPGSVFSGPLNRYELFSRVPWARTLTRLKTSTAIDSRLDAQYGEGSLLLMRSILRLMPRLDDLTIFSPIVDLALFQGLGREPLPRPDILSSAATNTDSTADSTETTTSSSSSSKFSVTGLKNYCSDEQPNLRCLHLQLDSRYCYSEEDFISTKEAWSQELKYRFRFLEHIQFSSAA